MELDRLRGEMEAKTAELNVRPPFCFLLVAH